ncbi:conserved hypothetical protein [Desulfamplus magnetovallimortis]|uniref:Uncharacterized protein n=1 Tax=Desulfamplus magnetovallimortis TaxID=1246637 RepID=A0A1W1HAM2_9BACT|nr:hypothetical protein [Desulfamplus magnetovallimortis]SLM29530.1 conserved hypothetical protein [Desulfamplus magnetovallimortis]
MKNSIAMKEKFIKEMELDNRQSVKIFDISRKISVDAYLVAMVARINIAIDNELFTEEQLQNISFDDIINKLGSHVQFEYKKERNFIMAKDKDAVFQDLVDTFTDNMIEYLSKDSFPVKFILKKYAE